MFRFLLIFSMVTGCGNFQGHDTPKVGKSIGPVTEAPETGRGPKGDPGSSCSVTDTPDGAEINCQDGSKATVANGRDGSDGSNGSNGVDGQVGPKGDQGPVGQAGSDAPEPQPLRVHAADGLEIGELVYADGTKFAVRMADGLRIKVDTFGYGETIATYFSGSGCTGERRAIVVNGQFGNFALDNLAGDGTFWQLTGPDLGTFNHASKETGNGVCVEDASFINVSYAVDEGLDLDVDLPFADPPRIAN